MSNLGFATQKEAIWALQDDGLTPAEIAERLGIRKQSVWARQSERRQAAKGLPDHLVEKARRFHDGALGVIAEALGVTVDQLRNGLGITLPRTAAVVIEPERKPSEPAALTPPAAVAPPIAETPPTNVQPTPAPAALALKPVAAKPAPSRIAPKAVAATRTFGLKTMDDKWLTRDGRGFSVDPAEAWTGTADAIKEARTRFANARFCKPKEIV